ncbi:hypothetical protein D3127_06200 [Campylobacter coli]|nr:hypothetical protein [Campylobacter coli]
MNLFQNLALKYSHAMMEKSLHKSFNVELLKNPQEKCRRKNKMSQKKNKMSYFCDKLSFFQP